MGRLTKDKSDELKEHAKLLYIHEKVTNQRELAKRVGVTEKTISLWITDGNWQKFQRSFILTREEQMANLLEELGEIANFIKNKDKGIRFADSKEAQIRRQLIKDIKDLETKALLSEMIGTLTSFLNFIRNTDLKEAQKISHIADEFIKSKLR